MTSNPAAMLAQAMRMGSDPRRMMEQMARNDPRISKALGMIQGKSPQQLEQMARNIAREQGIDLNQLARSLGAPIRL